MKINGKANYHGWQMTDNVWMLQFEQNSDLSSYDFLLYLSTHHHHHHHQQQQQQQLQH